MSEGAGAFYANTARRNDGGSGTYPRYSLMYTERATTPVGAPVDEDSVFGFFSATSSSGTDAKFIAGILSGSLPSDEWTTDLANMSAGMVIKADRVTVKPGVVLDPIAQGSAPAVAGSLIYNTSTGELNYHDSSGWNILTTGSGMTAHDLTGAFHTEDATGGAGNFLKADSPTTFSWQAHGLVASDVGAYTTAQVDSAIDTDIATHAALATVHQDAPGLIATHAAISGAHHAQAHALSGADHTGDLLYTQLDAIVDIAGVGANNLISRADHVHTDADGSSKITYSNLTGIPSTFAPSAHVLATTGPHTGTLPWGDLNKTGSSLADLATRTHASLSDAPTSAHHVRYADSEAVSAVQAANPLTLTYDLSILGYNLGIGIAANPSYLIESQDADYRCRLGRAMIGHLTYSDYATFCHRDMSAAGQYALLQGALGSTYLNAATGKTVYFNVNHVTEMNLTASGLQMQAAGARIDEFSTDVNLAGNSDVALVTEKAIKAYVDAASGGPGTGTQWKLPVWATTTTLGDSMISQDSGGTLATVGGALTVSGALKAGADGFDVDATGNITDVTVAAATVDTDKFIVQDGSQLKYRTGAQVRSDITAQDENQYEYLLSMPTRRDGVAPMTDLRANNGYFFVVGTGWKYWGFPLNLREGTIDELVVRVYGLANDTGCYAMFYYYDDASGAQIGAAYNDSIGQASTWVSLAFTTDHVVPAGTSTRAYWFMLKTMGDDGELFRVQSMRVKYKS